MKTSEELLQWYRQNHRQLPWRMDRNPYKIWISEVMLQQTTVSAVIPYFERFLEAFPTVEALAKADEERVLGLWSGLGYYSRARNLHRAAKQIAELGLFPQTYEELLKLPGLGPYTAAAVASIAFGEEVAAVDGNVIRVVTRLYDIAEDCTFKETRQLIQSKAQDLVSGQPPHEHNQAMMELGATICVPQNPFCLLCPVARFCQARSNGTAAQRPVKKKMKKQEPWVWEMLVIRRNGAVALVKEDNGTPWLKKTWVLPGRASPWTKSGNPESDFRHSITHHKIFVKLKFGPPSLLRDRQVKWVKTAQIKEVGTSSIVRKALEEASRRK